MLYYSNFSQNFDKSGKTKVEKKHQKIKAD